jgi:SpoVK/Ycf46/Vps4 family AAA+-type ATPase
MSRNRAAGVAAGKFGWDPHWRDTPLALWPKGCTNGLIFAMVPYNPHKDAGPTSHSVLVVNRQEMPAVLRMLEAIEPPKRISMMAGRDVLLPPDGYCWDSLVLNADLDQFVRRDFESFFQREDWFRRHNLPYRRGYLFYGPPGNGKTSAARIMASHPAVRAFGIDFRTRSESPYSPDQLSDLFESAAAQAPSLVILEDIDKVGAGEPEEMRQAINGLLSCLDGLSTEDGVIIVATANNLVPLSSALVKRPGRFDRVAQFPTPTADLRQRYLAHLSAGTIDGVATAEAAMAMDRFSYAQIRETYVLAGQFAFDRADDPTAAGLVQAARQIRREGRRMHVNGHGATVGFSVAEDQPQTPLLAPCAGV